ncbi:MAG: IclR family transcriptional regulator [Negativicutes bacterium]|nr:IclR family transcriptional regulator [Negativicutes bacterium]
MAQQILQSVENSLTVLEIMAATETELGVTDISKHLGISTSSAHRLLITLETKGFVVQNPNTGKYKPGMKIVTMGASILSNTNVIRECRPYLQELSQQTGETSILTLYSQGEVTCVDKITGSNPVNITALIGLKRPAYATATGKLLLAFLPPQQLNKYLQGVDLRPLTPFTIVEKEKLILCLNEIRKTGFAEDQQEAQEGLVCLAAPVRNGYGDVVAAMAVSGPLSRFNSRKEELIDHLRQMTEKVSSACGWQTAQ